MSNINRGDLAFLWEKRSIKREHLSGEAKALWTKA